MPPMIFQVELKLDKLTHENIGSISKSLETIARNLINQSNVESSRPNIQADEPAELSVNIPFDLIERPVSRYTVTRATAANGVIWNRITGHQRLIWREDGECIALIYNDSAVKTNWNEVKRLSRISKNRRRLEIQKILSTRVTDRITAVSVFVSSYIEGLVKAPGAPHEVEEDPDAAFRPMLAPYINTKPMEECGSIESLQGAY